MPRTKTEVTVYAAYRGDEFLVVGTASECAEYLNIKVDTFYSYVCRSIENLDIIKLDEKESE